MKMAGVTFNLSPASLLSALSLNGFLGLLVDTDTERQHEKFGIQIEVASFRSSIAISLNAVACFSH